MGLLDKIKDLFTDEEEVYETKEIELEEEEHQLPTFMRNKIEKEEQELKKEEVKKKEDDKEEVAVLIENQPKKEENKFPFNFDDEDFVEPTRFSRSVVQKEKAVEPIKETPQPPVVKPYGNKKELEKPKKFRPTPVISPVYGILDKNYKTEEVVSKDEDSYVIQRASKKVDFESVRKKAYGTTLTDDLKANAMCENCELLKEIKISKKVEKLSEEDLLYNMTIDDEKKEEVSQMDKDITLGEATENYDDFGVSYEVPPQRVRRKSEDVKIVNHADGDVVAEKVEVKEVVETKKEKSFEQQKGEDLEENKTKDLELTDDLFNLIDSMYKERND